MTSKCPKCGGPKAAVSVQCDDCRFGVRHVIGYSTESFDIVKELFEAICRESKGRIG